MKKYNIHIISSTILSLTIFISSTFYAQANNSDHIVPILNFEEFSPMLEHDNDTIYVVNFWATWCSPCVQEIPYFEKINEKYLEEKVRVILVSLDFRTQYDSRLIPFIEERQMKSKIILLDDPRSNRWIPKVSEEWTGAIPATVIYKGSERKFFEKVFTYEELEKEIQYFLN